MYPSLGVVLIKPKVLIADEPTSMLDVSLRSDILKLLVGFASAPSNALLLITHDMAVAQALTEELIVLEKGVVVVESGKTNAIFFQPTTFLHQTTLTSQSQLGGIMTTPHISQFPEGFTWGVATSSFQIEGSTFVDNRGESIWDRFLCDRRQGEKWGQRRGCRSLQSI